MTTSAPPSVGLDALLDRAARRAAPGGAREPAWLCERRGEALARARGRGLPTLRDEEWKYTNLAPLSGTAWSSPAPVEPSTIAALVGALRLPLHGGIHLVVVDGRYVGELASLPPLPEGLTVGSLARAIERRPELVEGFLGRVATGGDRPIADLSTACFEDGVLVHLAQGTCAPVPIDLLHVTTGRGTATFPRVLVVAGPESRVTLIERYVALGAGPYAVLPTTELALGRNAAVEHVHWQEEGEEALHLATLQAHQDRDSRFTSHALTLGARLSRSDLGVDLDAEGAECNLFGLYVVSGSRHADHHTRIDHRKPHGMSRELYKGILDGRGTGVFNGKVVVHPGAAKSDSRQANHNLLLSPDAVADTKPELEIYADDVKCAHGATVGRLEEEKLFYLRSRGLAESAARALLLRAFAHDVTDRISIEAVQARLDRWMSARLPGLATEEGGA